MTVAPAMAQDVDTVSLQMQGEVPVSCGFVGDNNVTEQIDFANGETAGSNYKMNDFTCNVGFNLAASATAFSTSYTNGGCVSSMPTATNILVGSSNVLSVNSGGSDNIDLNAVQDVTVDVNTAFTRGTGFLCGGTYTGGVELTITPEA
jgi:hypothetical protein